MTSASRLKVFHVSGNQSGSLACDRHLKKRQIGQVRKVYIDLTGTDVFTIGLNVVQQNINPVGLKTKGWPGEHLAILAKNTVIVEDNNRRGEDGVNDLSGRTMRTDNAGHEHVGVDDDSQSDFRLERTARISRSTIDNNFRSAPRLAMSCLIRERARFARA